MGSERRVDLPLTGMAQRGDMFKGLLTILGQSLCMQDGKKSLTIGQESLAIAPGAVGSADRHDLRRALVLASPRNCGKPSI